MDIVKTVGLIFVAAIVLLILSYVIGIAILAFIISMIPKLIYFIAAVGIGIIVLLGVAYGVKSRLCK